MLRRALLVTTVALLVAGLVPVNVSAGSPPCHVVKFNASGRAVGVYDSPALAIGGGDVADAGSTLQIVGTCVGRVTVPISMDLVGRGPATLDGGGAGIVLEVSPGASVRVTGLVIRHGRNPVGPAALVNYGELRLSDSAVAENSGPVAVANQGRLTIERSLIIGNDGTAIHNMGSLSLTDTLVSGNSATPTSGSGGINNGGTLTVVRSHIDANVSAAYGGGIYNWGTASVSGSSVSANKAAFGGGGITNTGFATMAISDSVISSNSAGLGGGGSINGGGVENLGALTRTASTLSGNSATVWGGAILNIGGYGDSLTLDGVTIGVEGAPNTSGYAGGGIVNFGGDLIFANHPTTIAYNTATWHGGGIFTQPGSTPGSIDCGSPSMVVYGPGNQPDDSYDGGASSVNTVCP